MVALVTQGFFLNEEVNRLDCQQWGRCARENGTTHNSDLLGPVRDGSWEPASFPEAQLVELETQYTNEASIDVYIRSVRFPTSISFLVATHRTTRTHIASCNRESTPCYTCESPRYNHHDSSSCCPRSSSSGRGLWLGPSAGSKQWCLYHP